MAKRLFLDEGVAKSIGYKELEIRNRRGRILGRHHQCLHFRNNAKLGHRERAELKFETNQAIRSGLDNATNSSRSLIVRDSGRDTAKNSEQEGACPYRRVGHNHIGSSEAC